MQHMPREVSQKKLVSLLLLKNFDQERIQEYRARINVGNSG